MLQKNTNSKNSKIIKEKSEEIEHNPNSFSKKNNSNSENNENKSQSKEQEENSDENFTKYFKTLFEPTSIIKKIKQSKEKKNINKINTNRSLSPRIKDNHLYNQKKIPVRTLDKYFKSISQIRLIDSPFSKINYNIRTDESTRASGSREFNFNYSLISNK